MLQLRLSREERDQKEAAEQDIEDLKQVHILLHYQIVASRGIRLAVTAHSTASKSRAGKRPFGLGDSERDRCTPWACHGCCGCLGGQQTKG